MANGVGDTAVKDLAAVKQLNQVLRESKDLFEATNGFTEGITKNIAEQASKAAQSLDLQKKSTNSAEQQAKAGKNIVGVLNVQNKGSKLGTTAAKAKLKLSRMLNFNMDDETKKLYEQYDIEQAILSKNKEKDESAKAGLKTLSKTAGSMLSIFGLSAGIVGLFSKFTKMTATIGKNFGALGMTNAKFKNDLLDAGAEAASLGQNIENTASISKDLTDNFR